MGGLYTNRNSVQQERIPFLSDIPYLGELFTSKYTNKEILQLLFFLRVRILTPNDMADGVLFDPEDVIRSTNDIGDIMRKSDELPNLETTVEKVNDEFIKNPLVSFKTLFGWGEDEEGDEGKSSPAKMSPASEAEAAPAESGESAPAESPAPAAVPANASADGE